MRVVHKSHPNAQEAITDYKVLGSSVLGELEQNLSALLFVRTVGDICDEKINNSEETP